MLAEPTPDAMMQHLPPGTHVLPVGAVTVGERFRRDLGDLQALADSIVAEGLLQPIGVTQDRHLVFGERRLRAVRDILGRDTIEVRVVDVTSIVAGEYAENEIRKDFTFSERVAIAEAVRRDLAGRHGSNQHVRRGEEVDRGPPPLDGKTRDLAARRAGFDSGRHLDRASNVVRLGVPALVEAMDRGGVSVTAASAIAREAPADQVAIVALSEPARIEELRRRKDEAARLRAAAEEQEKETGPTAYTGFVRKNGRLPDPAEAKTIARLDMRSTPSSDGGRQSPAAPTTKEQRAEKKRVEGYEDELWRTRQALQLLSMNETDPAVLLQHLGYIDRSVIAENIRKGRAFLNRFAREWRRHGR